MKKKCISLFLLLSFLVLQVLSPIGGKEVAVSAAEEDEGVANLKYSFRSIVYGQNIFTTADDGRNTVLIFGAADDEDTQRTVKSIAESSWVSRSDIRVIFAEISGVSASGMFPFKASYGSNYMEYCVNTDEDGSVYLAMCDYYNLFSDSEEFALPVTVLIDGKTDRIRHCLTGYQTADTIMDKMQDFVPAEPPEPSQEPTETPAAPSQQPVSSQQPVQSEGAENLYYTFESVDGTAVSTKSNPRQATVLVFGFTTCGWTQKMMKSIAESGWVGRSDIRVVFAEINGTPLTEVQNYAASYGCDDITFCYDEGYTIYYAAEKYYQQFYNGSESLGYPFTVLIDGENQVRDCIMGYETADNVLSKMGGFVDVGASATPSQEPASSEEVANLDYTFKKVDGTSVSTKSNPGQATVLVFGRTTCGNTQRTVKSIAASPWVGRSDIRVIFAEIDGAAQAAVQTFAATYGCNNITFCYDEGYDINRAMWEYYHLFSDSEDVTLPVIVLIDGNNRVRDCLTAYQKADTIMSKMQGFVAAEPTAAPSQEPAQKENPSKNSTVQDSSGNTYQVTQPGKGNGSGTVTYAKAGNSQAATVKVPSKVSIGGVTYNVTSVSAKAFRGNTKLKKVTIGKNVTSIGNSAFEGCTALKSIVIPSKVRSIGKNAFKNCKSLKSIRIKGNALNTVGKNAFKGIHAKAKIKVPKKQLKTYEKRLKGKGQKKTVKIIS